MMKFVVLAVLVVGGKNPSVLSTELHVLRHIYCTAIIDNIMCLGVLL